ncbi:hypothetical protein [Paucilactobacillus kaifaensis]|uniref:hypothetical protein n=1 Tax=Paucilactobacillus kaifaensis TaxID=2559921 RepID=UPI0010F8BEC7|nr:hypothetical protein [Paucilactobacillus kaifaensis]
MAEQTKFCPNCGDEIIGKPRFCPQCGFELNLTNVGNNQSIAGVKETKVLPTIRVMQILVVFFLVGVSFLVGYYSNGNSYPAKLTKSDKAKSINNSKTSRPKTKNSVSNNNAQFTEKKAAEQLKRAGMNPYAQEITTYHGLDGAWEFMDEGTVWVAYPDGLNDFPGDAHYY